MSNRTSVANKAIALAWERERQLIQEGKGTRDWTPEQQKSILEKGKAYDDDGKAFEGHHMKSVEAYSNYQGNADNIQFLTRDEHRAAHNGDFRNPTNGYYNPSTNTTKEFDNGKISPCKVINLTNPVIKNNDNNSEGKNEQSKSQKRHDKTSSNGFKLKLKEKQLNNRASHKNIKSKTKGISH